MKFSEKALMDLLMKINFMGKGPKKLLNKCYALFQDLHFLQFKQIPQEMPQKKISKFLSKLFVILDNPQYSQIVSWDCNGENVIIKDQSKMENEVIPLHFSLKKFTSFVRQLHLYNFQKKKSRNDCLIFCNSQFLKDQRDQALKIVRKRKTKAQMLVFSETKVSEKTIEAQRSLEFNEFTYQNRISQQNIKSYESLDMINIKSYQELLAMEENPFDILNFM